MKQIQNNNPVTIHVPVRYNESIRSEDSDMAKTSDAQLKAVKKYNKVHITQVKLALHNEKDADILQKLEHVSNKQKYMKDLIREDIKREQGNTE